MLVVFLSLLTAKDFSAKQAKLCDAAVLGVGASLCFQQNGEPKWEGVGNLGVFHLLLLPGGGKFPTCFPAVLSPCFPVIPAAPLTLIFALESAAVLAFPSVPETRQTEGQLPGAVKALPDVFGNSFALQRGDPGD